MTSILYPMPRSGISGKLGMMGYFVQSHYSDMGLYTQDPIDFLKEKINFAIYKDDTISY